jgi:N-acetylmuramate 1-kinase
MTSAKQVTNSAFELSPAARLLNFLQAQGINGQGIKDSDLVALTPDASTRNYFRIPWKKEKAIAAVYQEPFDPEFHPYLDITHLFLKTGIPVPEILEVDGGNGIIVQEDLGDQQLCQVYETASAEECEDYKLRAINIIARIQKATATAHELKSISSRLAFDEAKLSWELDFFVEHYFQSLRGETLPRADATELKAELNDISAELSAVPRVLCHRDFHTANLMLDRKDQLRVVDHQDARMGPASYDLVSFLLDRQPTPPSLAELRAHRLQLLEERRLLGLDPLDPDDFAREFRLMTIQRGLKAVGTFSYQTAVSGRGAFYEHFIAPTLLVVSQAAEWLERFPTLRRVIVERLNNTAQD